MKTQLRTHFLKTENDPVDDIKCNFILLTEHNIV